MVTAAATRPRLAVGTNERRARTELLLGHPAMEALKHARVAVFGSGGVGGYA